MSSTLRLSIIMVLLLATAALGLIAYSNMSPKPVVQVTENTPAPVTPEYTTVVVYAGNTVKKYAVKQQNTATMFSADASPKIAR